MYKASEIAQCIKAPAAVWCKVYFQNTVRVEGENFYQRVVL